MTISSFFNGLSANLISGGVGAVLVLAAMFWSANKTAATHNKAKMASWSMAPAVMVIAAILTHGIAAGIAIPKLQAMFQSAPVQNTMAMGGALSVAADSLLFSTGGDGGMVVGTDAFKAQEVNYVNEEQTASFASQPAPITANTEVKIVTNEQAVQAFNSFDATPTPSAAEYIASVVEQGNTQQASYTVRSGDSMSAIAAKMGVSVKALCAANVATVPNCNVINAGTVLAVPAVGSGGAPIVNAIPSNFGQQTTVYNNTQPTPAPVYVRQSNQQAAAPVRNQASGQVVITSNADAINAVHALAQPTAAPVVVAQPTARPAYVLDELLGKPQKGSGQAYIDQFLAEQKVNTASAVVASTGN